MDADEPPLSFLGRRLPPAFKRRVVVLAPGQTLVYEVAEWQDEIAVVEHGQIELECLDNKRYSFERGAVLCLDRLPLRVLHNCGRHSAVLVAVSRRAALASLLTTDNRQ